MADHNDPNAVNSIFSDIDVSAADLYDIFGFPSNDTTDGEKVVIALTFASVPAPGVLDSDMLYRIQISAEPRVVPLARDDHSLKALLRYFDALKDKYLGPFRAAEIRVTVDPSNRATVAAVPRRRPRSCPHGSASTPTRRPTYAASPAAWGSGRSWSGTGQAKSRRRSSAHPTRA